MPKFTPEEREQLSQSPYIRSVGKETIHYGEVFEREFIRLYQLDYSAAEIFRLLGLDPDIVGSGAITSYEYRLKQRLKEEEGQNKSLPRKSIHQEMSEMKKEMTLLKAENEFLKKNELIEQKYRQKTDKRNKKNSN